MSHFVYDFKSIKYVMLKKLFNRSTSSHGFVDTSTEKEKLFCCPWLGHAIASSEKHLLDKLLYLTFPSYVRHVKMSSPNINSFLLFGCVVSYISVYIKPVGVTYGFACKVIVNVALVTDKNEFLFQHFKKQNPNNTE